MWRDRDIAADSRYLETPCASLLTRSPSHRAQPRRKPGFSTLDSSSGRETDSPLEGAGFEPSVPLEVLTVGIVPCRLRGPFHASLPKTKFAADSALEGDGFELSVPRERGDRFELSLLFMSLKPSAF